MSCICHGRASCGTEPLLPGSQARVFIKRSSRGLQCRGASEQVGAGERSPERPYGGNLGPRQAPGQRFWQRLRAAALARPAPRVEEEVAWKRVQLSPSRIVNPEEKGDDELGDVWEVETADDFFRGKGPAAPGLMALSFVDSVLLQFRTDEQRGRTHVRPQKRRRAPADEDWSSYAKYDIFRELLASSPLLKEERYSPLKNLLRAIPQSGESKYDFIRALLNGISSEPKGSHKWDLIHEVLHSGRVEAAQEALTGDPEQLRKYDIVHDLLHSSLITADWGLPTSGLAHDLLHFDEWGSRDQDPVRQALESSWHGNVRHRWDPLVAALGATPPTIRAQWDPLQAVLAASTPASERGWLDPFGDILKSSKGVRAADSKYNPLPGLFAAEAPARGGSDLVGDIIRGLINLDLRGTPDAVGDILKGLIAQDLSKTPDAVNDMLKGLLRAADFTTAPNLSGLADGPRSTKYFPKIWEAAPPERGWMDPIGNAAEKLKAVQPLSVGRSKYDPVPGVLEAEARPLDTNRADVLRSLLRARVPQGKGKFDPLPEALAAQAEPPGSKRFDVLGGLAQAQAPSGRAKFDPLPGLWNLRSRKEATETTALAPRSADTPPPNRLLEASATQSPKPPSKSQGAQRLPAAESESAQKLPAAAPAASRALPSPETSLHAESDAESHRLSQSNGDRPDPPLQMDGSRSFQQDSSPPQEAAPSANLQAVSKSPAVPKDALLEKVQGLEARMRQLTQQSEALRKKFGQKLIPQKKAVQQKPQPASQQRTHEISEVVELERQNNALKRQLTDAAARKEQLLAAARAARLASGERDLVPDILRLKGALWAAPVAGYDPLAVFQRRGGSKQFQAVAVAFRELRIDSRFAERHSPLYRLMLGSGAEISESKRDVMAAEGGSGNFLQDLEDRRRYAPLHELLSGRPPEAVVGAICALGALTK